MRALVEQFYAKLPLIDLGALNPARAAQVAAASYEFIRARKPGMPKIDITNVASRTVIHILNDDMPFLVDSVTMELTRLGFTIGQVVHPIIRLKRDTKPVRS